MADKPIDTKPAAVEEGTGIALEGASALPHNHRLRAEALAKRGNKNDPDGIITPELIADAKERLANLKAAEEKAAEAAKPAATETTKGA